MCRIDPNMDEIVLEKEGCRQMDFTGKRMVCISEEGMKNKKTFEYWINSCLKFNTKAKKSKKKPNK